MGFSKLPWLLNMWKWADLACLLLVRFFWRWYCLRFLASLHCFLTCWVWTSCCRIVIGSMCTGLLLWKLIFVTLSVIEHSCMCHSQFLLLTLYFLPLSCWCSASWFNNSLFFLLGMLHVTRCCGSGRLYLTLVLAGWFPSLFLTFMYLYDGGCM